MSVWASEAKVWKDEQISLTINKLERTNSYPNDLRTPGYRYKPPEKGKNYFVIYLTVNHIKKVHLGMPEPSMPTKPSLYDEKDIKYDMANVRYQGIEYKEGLTGDQYEIVKGAKGIMLFVIPQKTKPARLEFIYPFWVSWENKVIKYGKIAIDLGEITVK
jgi:hypothetical protein